MVLGNQQLHEFVELRLWEVLIHPVCEVKFLFVRSSFFILCCVCSVYISGYGLISKVGWSFALSSSVRWTKEITPLETGHSSITAMMENTELGLTTSVYELLMNHTPTCRQGTEHNTRNGMRTTSWLLLLWWPSTSSGCLPKSLEHLQSLWNWWMEPNYFSVSLMPLFTLSNNSLSRFNNKISFTVTFERIEKCTINYLQDGSVWMYLQYILKF